MSAEAQSADADTTPESEEDDSGYTVYPQVTQHPHSFVVGDEIVDVVTSATIDSSQEKTGHGVGVVYENPTVVGGSIWRQRDIPEGFDTAAEFNVAVKRALADEGDYVNGAEVEDDDIGHARDRIANSGEVEGEIDWGEVEYSELRLPVDYKVADEDDRECDVQEVSGQVLGIDVGGGVFGSEKVEEFSHDEVMVWYGGIAGQFILRALDFNGRPSARYKEDGYLVKGLLQHPLGWFDRDTENYNPESTNRSKLARSADNGGLGRPPRVARPPVLRSDIEGEEVFIEIDRYEGGDMLEATIAFNDFEGDNHEEATPIKPRYEQEPEAIIEEEFDVDDATEVYELYHGDGWQPEIEGDGEAEDTSGASFDVDVDTGEDDDGGVEHPTDNEVEFANMVSEKLAGSSATPDMDIFPVEGEKTDLEGLVGHNADQFDETPDVEAIREVIYQNVNHLDPADL